MPVLAMLGSTGEGVARLGVEVALAGDLGLPERNQLPIGNQGLAGLERGVTDF